MPLAGIVTVILLSITLITASVATRQLARSVLVMTANVNEMSGQPTSALRDAYIIGIGSSGKCAVTTAYRLTPAGGFGIHAEVAVPVATDTTSAAPGTTPGESRQWTTCSAPGVVDVHSSVAALAAEKKSANAKAFTS